MNIFAFSSLSCAVAALLGFALQLLLIKRPQSPKGAVIDLSGFLSFTVILLFGLFNFFSYNKLQILPENEGKIAEEFTMIATLTGIVIVTVWFSCCCVLIKQWLMHRKELSAGFQQEE